MPEELKVSQGKNKKHLQRPSFQALSLHDKAVWPGQKARNHRLDSDIIPVLAEQQEERQRVTRSSLSAQCYIEHPSADQALQFKEKAGKAALQKTISIILCQSSDINILYSR